MTTFHDLEAERNVREPLSIASVRLAQACKALKRLAVRQRPLAELEAARDAIGRAFEDVAANGRDGTGDAQVGGG